MRECFLIERRSRQCEAPSPREDHSVYCARGTAGAHHHRTVVLENTHLWGLIPPRWLRFTGPDDAVAASLRGAPTMGVE